MNRRGQSMMEMVILIPFLLTLAAGVLAVAHLCWQGIKVQQAANLGARIHSQQRVSGGTSLQSILSDNGLLGSRGDKDLSQATPAELEAYQQPQQSYSGVYGTLNKTVRSLFGSADQSTLSIPAPKYGSVGNSEQVKVQRVVSFPKVFGISVKPVLLEGVAYGGEDTRMYGVQRWGGLGNGQQFWSQRDPNTNALQNLSNPRQD